MNAIPTLQNEEEQLRLLRARRQTYFRADCIMLTQVTCALLLPVAAGIAATVYSEARPYIAAAALLAVVLDTLWADRRFNALMKTAAKFGEEFDCRVLDLPWDDFTVGSKVEPEETYAAAEAYSARHDDRTIANWYPVAVGTMPLAVARIVCQRSNVRYDSNLRRSYSGLIKVTAVLLCIALIGVGLYRNLPMSDWVLTLVPAVPMLAWAAREYYRKCDTADMLDIPGQQTIDIWRRAIAGGCSDRQCCEFSRQLQTAIYRHRASSSQILPIIYRLKRSSLESGMTSSAEDFVREYKQSAATQQSDATEAI